LCLGHTLDDRLETLRMRAARPGGEIRMAGPSPFDPSPVWPEGEGLILARPFLELTRATLRDYLRGQGAAWIEDPSNTDAAYERVRLRSTPIGREAAASLLRRSDAARAERDRLQSEAFNLIEAASTLLAWGGMRLDAGRFAAAEPEVALKALERLVLAASGRPAPPRPAQLGAVLKALAAGRAVSVGGAHLTACGVLGRDAGVAGRADGVAAAPALRLGPGQSGVFDGRWRVRADRPVRIEVLGERAGSLSGDVPPSLRPGLAAVCDAVSGDRLGVAGLDHVTGVESVSLAQVRIDAPRLSLAAPTWFDDRKIAAQVRAALAKPVRRPNMT
jgi:tRNA(Ile)-lysidine synthase